MDTFSNEITISKDSSLPTIQLAKRSKRLFGHFIDILLFLPAQYFGNLSGTTTIHVLGWAYGFILGIINLLLLHEEGQTVGKMIMKTRIILVKNERVGGIW